MAEKTQRRPASTSLQNDLRDAAKVGGVTGGIGFVVGATAGTLRSTSPLLFGVVSSVQWFGLGTTFWASRSAILSAWYEDRALATPRDTLYASSIASGFSGALLGLITRGRKNVLPGSVMFSVFGALGQSAVNAWKERPVRVSDPTEEKGIMRWVAKQSWSPFSILTNDEYQRILEEKIFKLDVEVALIDDRLAAMRQRLQHGEIAVTAPANSAKLESDS